MDQTETWPRVRMDEPTGSMSGLVCLVTGATSGIGRATAAEFARAGATLAVVSREEQRGRAALEEFRREAGNDDLHLFVADLSSQASIGRLAQAFAQRFERLDVLVNVAGLFVRERQVTEDGLELMFATNHLAPFLLTLLLLPQLQTARQGRVITVTAPSTVRPDFEDLQGERRFRPTRTFGASKAGNLLFTFALARRLANTHITANAYHPGVVRTPLMRSAGLPMRLLSSVLGVVRGRRPEEAAAGIAELAVSPRFLNVNGALVHDGRVISSPFEQEVETQERLFRASEDLTGLHFDPQTGEVITGVDERPPGTS